MALVWSTDATVQLIQMWKEYPFLYRKDDVNYKNRTLRAAAVQDMAVSLGVNKEEVIRKMHNLRCNMNTELRRTRANPGLNSPWKYYGMLKFIDDSHSELSSDIEDLYSETFENDYSPLTFKNDVVYVNVGKDEYAAVTLKPESVNELDDSVGKNLRKSNRQSSAKKQLATETNSRGDAVVCTRTNSNLSNGSKVPISDKSDLADAFIKEESIEEITAGGEEPDKSNSRSNSCSSTYNRNPPQPPALVRPPAKRNHSFLDDEDIDDDFTAFGRFVASELRQMRSEERRRRLKRKIQRSILDMGEEDDLEYSISMGPIND